MIHTHPGLPSRKGLLFMIKILFIIIREGGR